MPGTISDPPLAGPLRDLAVRLEETPGFSQVLDSLKAGHSATLDGVWGSSSALALASLLRHAPGTVLCICPHPHQVEHLLDALELFSDQLPVEFPALTESDAASGWGDLATGLRLRQLKSLTSSTPPKLLVTSTQSLLQGVPSPDWIRQGTRVFRVGDTLDLSEFSKWLASHKWVATTAVALPGEFAVRGGLIDLFAADWEQPIRVELFGDEITSLRTFDPATQRSMSPVQTVELTMGLAQGRGMLPEFLPPACWIVLWEPHEIEEEARLLAERSDATNAFLPYAAVAARLFQFPSITLQALSGGSLEATCKIKVESVERFSGDVHKVRDELDTTGTGQDVFLICDTQAEIKRLQEVFTGTRLLGEGRMRFVPGRLQAGFRLVRERVLVVSSSEIFHRSEVAATTRRKLGRIIDSFLDLREGDLVVHLAHGIAKYLGLRLLDKAGHVEEHLELEFDGGTRVYVPTSKINLVQKFVGGSKSRPALAKLGGKTWVKQKQAAEEAVTDLAAEMLQIRAMRATRPGIAFPADTPWQQEFDLSFPYTETPDQVAAIEAVKADMQSQGPMDRLICGDVGFGKTEVAMRAAFKAIDHGHQVAVLVPTTILAEQHRRTFQSRMAAFPFTIASLSRFGTRKEQQQVIQGLEEGKIDIVIGTHRLAQQDVKFHNLGLIIIDEEQRFGVEVKERLKSLRAVVDVLTMTATPIPRTLHMSLLGIRDISNLETAPIDRLAVETRVTRFDADLIRHAILRELDRQGQVFFVHNRVHDIELLAKRLRQIVPEATIQIGHGQMPEDKLEEVMLGFVQHKFDVLLATTIVESGLDIPNANTIFIDQADNYGLADLHQLRGRVGRYKNRAYCYLLLDPNKNLTPNATRRLRAIEEFSDMGAGFALSMRDLEIRGAGNILGTQQSGHIATVGYELYCQLLEDAVRRLKKLPPRESADVALELPGEAFFPRGYVPDMRSKVDLYRRVARVGKLEELADLRSEMTDRFGPIPTPVERMLAQGELRILARAWKLQSIHLEENFAVLTYADLPAIKRLQTAYPKRVRIVDHQSAYVPLATTPDEPDELLAELQALLRSK